MHCRWPIHHTPSMQHMPAARLACSLLQEHTLADEVVVDRTHRQQGRQGGALGVHGLRIGPVRQHHTLRAQRPHMLERGQLHMARGHITDKSKGEMRQRNREMSRDSPLGWHHPGIHPEQLTAPLHLPGWLIPAGCASPGTPQV